MPGKIGALFHKDVPQPPPVVVSEGQGFSRTSLHRLRQREVDGDPGQPEDIVGETHHIDQYKKIHQGAFAKAQPGEGVEEGVVDGAFVPDGGMDDTIDHLPFFFRVHAGANLEGFLFFPSGLYRTLGVGRQTIFAAVELGNDQIDAFAVTGMKGILHLSFDVLGVGCQGVGGITDGGVEIGHLAHALLELVEDRLGLWCNLVAGRDVESGHIYRIEAVSGS
jgi:hypothetical protein